MNKDNDLQQTVIPLHSIEDDEDRVLSNIHLVDYIFPVQNQKLFIKKKMKFYPVLINAP